MSNITGKGTSIACAFRLSSCKKMEEHAMTRLAKCDACERAQRFIDLFIDKHPDARTGVIPEGPYVLPVSE